MIIDDRISSKYYPFYNPINLWLSFPSKIVLLKIEKIITR